VAGQVIRFRLVRVGEPEQAVGRANWRGKSPTRFAASAHPRWQLPVTWSNRSRPLSELSCSSCLRAAKSKGLAPAVGINWPIPHGIDAAELDRRLSQSGYSSQPSMNSQQIAVELGDNIPRFLHSKCVARRNKSRWGSALADSLLMCARIALVSQLGGALFARLQVTWPSTTPSVPPSSEVSY
jgi:hypothetical protein